MFDNLINTNKKIFCISIQRTGTTSVGSFFKKVGYSVAGWSETNVNKWGKLYFDGNYNAIFKSEDFRKNIVFQDGPWSMRDFYKFLYFKFPRAKFILFTRNSDDWFDSMMNHSKGKTIGNTFRHCNIYRRETEYYSKYGDTHSYESDEIDNLMHINESHREHYKSIYENRNRQVIDFFNSKDESRFIHLRLEQKDKWILLGEFFRIQVSKNFDVHSNRTMK